MIRRALVPMCGLLITSSLLVGLHRVGADNGLENLVVTDPPDGFVLSTDPTVPNGDYTLAELGQFGGVNADDFPDDDGTFAIYGRTWESPSNDRVLLLLVRGPAVGGADEFVRGVTEQADSIGAAEFDTGINDVEGRILSVPGGAAYVTAWYQGRYGVQIVSVSTDPARAQAALLEVTRDEVDLLTRSAGVSVGVVADEHENKSAAFRVGQVIGYVLIVGVIVGPIIYFVRRSRRRQAEAEWSPQPLGGFGAPGIAPPWPTSAPPPPPPPPPYDA